MKIDELSSKMKEHMEKISQTPLRVSSEPILVSIMTNDPSMWSVILVDLPGFENIASDEQNEQTVRLLNEMNYKFLRNRQENDLVVLVKDGLGALANDHLFNTDQFKELNLNSSNHIVVVTKVNSKIKPEMYGSHNNTQIENQFFQQLESFFKTDIFYISTVITNPLEKNNDSL